MKLNKRISISLAVIVFACCVIISGFFIGKKLTSDAGNMEFKIGNLTVVVPDNMLCADVKSFLNVRISPNSNSAVIAKLYPGDAVEFVGEKGSWTTVNIKGQTGYVFSKYTVRGADLKKYIKKNLDKFEIEGTILKNSFTPVYKEEKQVGESEPAYTMKGEISKKTTVYATKSTNSKIANETEKVERYVVTVDGLHFRARASADGKILYNLYKGNYVNVISDKNTEWLKIRNNGETGYISKRYAKLVTVEEQKSNLVGNLNKNEQVTVSKLWKNWAEISYQDKTTYIKRSAVNVTAKLEEGKENVVTLAENNEKCSVLDVKNNIAYVKVSNKKGYMDATAIRAKIDFSDIKVDKSVVKKATDQMPKGSLGNASKDRQKLVKFALKYVGNKYVWGGNSLTNGVDCSGFTQQVYLHFGIKLNRCSYEQVKNGKEITFDELQPGDLVFYYDNGLKRIGHVALYIGDGQIVHAQSSRTGIVISKWNHRTPYKAVTILGK